MALFMIVGHDVAESSKQRHITRPKHIARLEVLQQQGRIIIAGPNPIDHDNLEKGMSGSMMVVEFDSLEAVQDWCNQEPYLLEGVYSHVDIKPFTQVLPASE